jgi:hypothetical protein
MRNVHAKWGYALGAIYAAFVVVCMTTMAGGMASFLNPFGLLFLVWVLLPIVLVAWLQGKSKLWWIPLFPTAILGAFAMYDMAFHPASSTAALGLIFFPLYQWAFIGIVGFVIMVIDVAKRGRSPPL